MGLSWSSSQLEKDEMDELVGLSSFTPDQIHRLYSRFRQIDKQRTGSIAAADLIAIPELAMNPLAFRVIAQFQVSMPEASINFKQFVAALSVFSAGARREQKLAFAFNVYDVDGDGLIGASDLRTVLKLMVGKSISDEEVRVLVDQTIADADTVDRDGSISFDEFKRALFSADLEKSLTIEF
ncbi:calcineurin subunit B [Zopfochytrium polystomum]|nr:calcineurin subunit B [Zopfochytrium polystomum]